jgi:hydrogenase maturation protease
VELARALGSLPEHVVVVGVEGACFDIGAPLTAEVAAALPEAVAAVVEALGGAEAEVVGDVSG